MPRPKFGGRDFQPGYDSRRNAGGRPKKTPVTDEHRRLAVAPVSELKRRSKSIAEAVAKATLRKAVRGDIRAIVEATDRGEGKVPQAVTGAEGAPLFPVELADSAPKLFAMTKEQLEELIRGVK